MLRRLLACALAIAFLSPVAAAFSSNVDEVHIRFDQDASPLILAAGKVDAAGVARDGLLSAFVSEASVGPVPSLRVVDTRGLIPTERIVTGATMLVHSGHLAWRFTDASAPVNASAAYAFALALPKSPVGGDGPGVVMAGPDLVAGISWSRGTAQLVPANATITILDSSGKAVQGYDRVRVNENANARGDQEDEKVVAFEASGAFSARVPSRALASGLDASNAAMRIDVRAANEDRFVDAARSVEEALGVFSQGESSGGDSMGEALRQLGGLSGVFNGAVLILQTGQDNATAEPVEMRLGDREIEPGPFTLLRSQDLALAWGDGAVGIQGHSKVAVSGEGFSVAPPLVVGPVPIISLLFWLAAVGSVVFFFMKRPPAAKGKWSIRGISWAVYAVVLVAVFWWWDASFANTFGTSLLTLVSSNGFNPDDINQFALVFGLEMFPWGLAALLFALPVRIGLGVLLRYRGEGSSFKGIAKAGGLVSLAIFGPIYALWIANVLIGLVVKFAPAMFGA